MKARFLLFTMVAVATLPAANITTVYNTGEQDITHNLLALGSTDPHWFTGANGSGTAMVVSNPPNPAWLPNNAAGTHSEWIDNTGQRVLPTQEFIYTQFDLTGLD